MARLRAETGRRPATRTRVREAPETAVKGAFSVQVARIVDLCRSAGSPETPTPRPTGAARGGPKPEHPPDPGAGTALAHALGDLELDSALRLCALARAGRDARDLAATRAAMEADGVDSTSALAELVGHGPPLDEHLRRGAAIALATGFDLEKPFSAWPVGATLDLEARAWLSFARELAHSPATDWQCLAMFESRARRRIAKLYLRAPNHQWWSFRRLLDRPSPLFVDRERKRGVAAGVTSGTLDSMAGQSCESGLQALRRALRAIRARLGVPLDDQLAAGEVRGRA